MIGNRSKNIEEFFSFYSQRMHLFLFRKQQDQEGIQYSYSIFDNSSLLSKSDLVLNSRGVDRACHVR